MRDSTVLQFQSFSIDSTNVQFELALGNGSMFWRIASRDHFG